MPRRDYDPDMDMEPTTYTFGAARAPHTPGTTGPAPIVLALPKRISETLRLALALNNPEYRFETTADGKLAVSRRTEPLADVTS
jgi:hypothetical protein